MLLIVCKRSVLCGIAVADAALWTCDGLKPKLVLQVVIVVIAAFIPLLSTCAPGSGEKHQVASSAFC